MITERDKITAICREEILAVWRRMPTSFPDFFSDGDIVETDQKLENQELLSVFLEKTKKMAMIKNPEKGEEKEWAIQWEREVEAFVNEEKIIGIKNSMPEEMFQSCKESVKQFVRGAFSFDEEISLSQIWQAMRNYLIYVMIAALQGEKADADDPILAYSLLYPYTDNYIDDALVTQEAKRQYNALIARRLQGEKVSPQNLLEEQTCRLLDMVLSQYQGEQQKEIAGVLLLLLEAQQDSIQQQKAADLSAKKIEEISVYKGGTSVLADYLLVTNDYEEKEVRFYLAFGFILQMVDDLQDIAEDEKDRSSTLMTTAQKEGRLEENVNRLLWFTKEIIQNFEPRDEILHNFVLRHCLGITMISVARNANLFSKAYLKTIEPYLPFTMKFFRKRGKEKAQEKQSKKGQEMEKELLKKLKEFVNI